MRVERLLVLSLACIPLVLFGCTPKPDSPARHEFSFSSGGAYHLQGYGEWTINLDQNGSFTVSHNVQGDIMDYGVFLLTEGENEALWDLIDALNIRSLESSQRPGLPDEAQYTLILIDNGSRHEVQLWIGEAREIEKLDPLVEQVGTLIEYYTGQIPVLR